MRYAKFLILFLAVSLYPLSVLADDETGHAQQAYNEIRAAGKTTLFDDLGGEQGIRAVNTHMLELNLSDPQMAPIFEHTNMERLKDLLFLHTCHIADGPCDFRGQDMRRAHEGLNIRTIHFNRLTENMQKAMDAEGIPFRTQNKILARLAPFHDDVTGRSPIPPKMKTKPQSYPALPDSFSGSMNNNLKPE